MALPRTFIGFSSTDRASYYMMTAWKANENIDFDFADFQLDDALDSEDEHYIKSIIRPKIRYSDTYALLIGNDTYTKTTYVKWEIEVAIEKGCRLIGINLNHSRFNDWLCPWFFLNVGALFVPYSPQIVGLALEPWKRPSTHMTFGNWFFTDYSYHYFGYKLEGTTARLPPAPNPFAGGNRPPWTK
jgi:hypothetical protein